MIDQEDRDRIARLVRAHEAIGEVGLTPAFLRGIALMLENATTDEARRLVLHTLELRMAGDQQFPLHG
jgi:hypothetical protein